MQNQPGILTAAWTGSAQGTLDPTDALVAPSLEPLQTRAEDSSRAVMSYRSSRHTGESDWDFPSLA